MMTGKFDNVPLDKGTKVLFQLEANFGDFEVLYQKWCWDHIVAESIIFENEDISRLTDDNIISEVRSSPLVRIDSEVTLKRSDARYTFANFNFDSQ